MEVVIQNLMLFGPGESEPEGQVLQLLIGAPIS
jgi:hypothetical protein